MQSYNFTVYHFIFLFSIGNNALPLLASASLTQEASERTTLFEQDALGNTKFHRAFDSANKNDPLWTLSEWFDTTISNSALKNNAGETPLDIALKKADLAMAYEIVIHELVLTENPMVTRSDLGGITVHSEFLKKYLKKLIKLHHQRESFKQLSKKVSSLTRLLSELFFQDQQGNGGAHNAVIHKNYSSLEAVLTNCALIDLDITDMLNNFGKSCLDLALEMKDHRSVDTICRLILNVNGAARPDHSCPFKGLFEQAFREKHSACLKACLEMILWMRTDSLTHELDLGIRYLSSNTQRQTDPLFSPLHLAACASGEVTRKLLHDVEDPSLFRHRSSFSSAPSGSTPVASETKIGFDPMQYHSFRFTPLHAAAFAGNAPSIALLIKAGALVNFQDADWRTPLHLVAVALNEHHL